jgi:hypothetical protein
MKATALLKAIGALTAHDSYHTTAENSARNKLCNTTSRKKG